MFCNQTASCTCATTPCTKRALRVFSAMPAKPVPARVSAGLALVIHNHVHGICGRTYHKVLPRLQAHRLTGPCARLVCFVSKLACSCTTMQTCWPTGAIWLVQASRFLLRPVAYFDISFNGGFFLQMGECAVYGLGNCQRFGPAPGPCARAQRFFRQVGG